MAARSTALDSGLQRAPEPALNRAAPSHSSAQTLKSEATGLATRNRMEPEPNLTALDAVDGAQWRVAALWTLAWPGSGAAAAQWRAASV
ncbi:hypothetical protein MKX07_005532 [Trichoderma sp. CBMAI-0711]|nr:hypothetical protein MKX07_005532 [Trichoderma sp. CBMAI-0711]